MASEFMNGSFYATGLRKSDSCGFLMKLNLDLTFNFSKMIDCSGFNNKWSIDALTAKQTILYGVANAVTSDYQPIASNSQMLIIHNEGDIYGCGRTVAALIQLESNSFARRSFDITITNTGMAFMNNRVSSASSSLEVVTFAGDGNTRPICDAQGNWRMNDTLPTLEFTYYAQANVAMFNPTYGPSGQTTDNNN